jgi:tetratricopeptide (TPR) repeat protein
MGRPSGGGINRTPSFSSPGGGRPGNLPSGGGGFSGSRPNVGGAGGLGSRPNVGTRPSQLPSNRPGIGGGDLGSRPNIGNRPSQLPSNRPGIGGADLGNRPNIGNRPSQLPSNRPGIGDGRPGTGGGIANLPSTRPDIGRPGSGFGPGISTLPAAAAGAGLANRLGDRRGTLPGLGDGRPSQLPANRPIQERQQALQNRLDGRARADQLPARDWNQVREDWQNQRNDVRENWQNYRDQAREDWQNWFDDNYPWHSGWYWGHAAGYWNRWDYLWDNYPVATALGVTWWGANTIGSLFGCGDYSNPYYDGASGGEASYSEPIVTMPASAPVETTAPDASALPPGVSPEAVGAFNQARDAFLRGDYQAALQFVDQTIAKLPHDAVAHEFRALVLFALQRYKESAAALNAVLAAGPGWDAKTLTGLYPDMDTYTKHLRALEAYRDQNPKAADARFLLGYHYLICGYPTESLHEFKKAKELEPRDSVAAALVASLTPREPPTAGATPTTTAPTAVAEDKVVGAWTAAGKGDSKYQMNLKNDGSFTWAFTRGVRKQEVKGVYSVEGNVLAMEPDRGGTLAAEITAKTPEALQFKMIGNAADDPGLEFRKEKTD